MEEKKLTDEEIAKAILQSIEYSKTITYFDEWGNCKSIFVKDALDLIHRLQAEVEELRKAKVIHETVDYCYEDLKNAQAEIERLSKKAVVLEVETNNQKAEIERLKEENFVLYRDRFTKNELDDISACRVKKATAELQKQVDELTDKLGKVLSGIKADELLVAKGIEQAVKDTAKEIYDFAKGFFTWDEEGFVRELKELVQDYGVEVE